MRRRILLAVAAAGILALSVAPAHGHVTLQPAEAPAGGFTRLDVRVPNERDRADTTRVAVKFPPGFLSVSTEPVPGWSVSIKRAKLDEPVEEFGEQVTERVDTVTFTARGDGIGPGEFQDFGLSLRMPERPNTSLTFRATQTYGNGEVVRWIGAPDSEEPAPQVRLTAAEEKGGATHAAEAEGGEEEDDDEESDVLPVVALVVGGLGLLAGLAALAAARRGRTT